MRKRVERDHLLTITIAMVMVIFCLSFPFVISVHVLTYIQNCDDCLDEFSMRMITSGIYFSARCVLINSTLDPFLLILRMPKIRQAVRKTYARHVCLFSKSLLWPQISGEAKVQNSNDKQETNVNKAVRTDIVSDDG